MRLAQPVLRRMLRTWLAAVCSLIDSSAPISRLLSPRATSRRICDLARREPVGQAGRGRGGAERADPRRAARHADPLGQRRRLAEQRVGPLAVAAPRAQQQAAVLVGGVGEPRRGAHRAG